MTCRRRSLRGNKYAPCQSVVLFCKQCGGWYVFQRRMVKKRPFLCKFLEGFALPKKPVQLDASFGVQKFTR